jgi:hypothetical protein
MQTVVWMSYSCSSYFSDQYSYITHFIPSYSLGDMIFARFKHFSEKQRREGRLGRTGPNLLSSGPELSLRRRRM